MMKPYYEQSGVTIYHGDYRDVMPSLALDAIITDQPFGTGWARGGGKSVGEFHAKHERPAWDVFSLDWLEGIPPSLKFWSSFAPISQESRMRACATSMVYWRKTNPRPLGPALEPIFLWPVYLPQGIEWVGYNGDTPHHPCEKPEALMRWLLMFCDPLWNVADPFMGSGTTLVAAKRLGRNAIGIEIEEEYCEIAAKRLAQEALPLGIAG